MSIKAPDDRVRQEPTNRCPFCAEDIRLEASVCKHCGRGFPDPPRRETPEEARESTKRANLILRRGTARVLWHGATRPDRRFATPETWKAILAEGAEHLQPGPLERDSPIVQLLAGRDRASAYAVQYLWQEPLEAEPADVVFKLDLRLQMVQQA